MKSTSQAAAAIAFRECWIRNFGSPKRVIGDGAFNNAAWGALAHKYGFTIDTTPPHDYRPRGMVERMHRTLGAALAKDAQDMLLTHTYTREAFATLQRQRQRYSSGGARS